jgi:FkbM family methyltransferase
MEKEIINWKLSIQDQIRFYNQGFYKTRKDDLFDWKWWARANGITGKLKEAFPYIFIKFKRIFYKKEVVTYSVQWIENHYRQLWETRVNLADQLSKLYFDNYLVLRGVGSSRFYFPRTDHLDFIDVIDVADFSNKELPNEYGSLPIKFLKVKINESADFSNSKLNIISPLLGVQLENSFRQYFISRDGNNFMPRNGDVVFDCGACVGEISTLFAGFVGETGEVHTFDPIPLHSKFIRYHAEINPRLKHIFKVNEFAVDSKTRANNTEGISDINIVSAGGLVIDIFNSITLDDYSVEKQIKKIDYIKMDIEGYELNALIGARQIISNFKPRLAICVYHKPEDLWEIMRLIRSYNSSYFFYFGHHSPVGYEAVLYAY